MLLFKRDLRSFLLRKAGSLFGESSQAWLEGPVAQHTQSFKAWKDAEATDRGWQAGRPHFEIAFLNLLVESVFRTAYDAPLKLAVKFNKTVAEAMASSGLMEVRRILLLGACRCVCVPSVFS